MTTNDSGTDAANAASENKVTELKYLVEMMGGKKNLIKGIIDSFLIQIPEELFSINNAIAKTDYYIIKNISHSMKSSLSIMGISKTMSILKEMEDLGSGASQIERIKTLNISLNIICKQAIEEIEKEKHNYV
jgi:HPt (histidine-containing phosphotransfer) domain-containing protein